GCLPAAASRVWCVRSATVAFFFFQAEDGIRDFHVTGVQTCALPISVPLGTCLLRPAAGAGQEAPGGRPRPRLQMDPDHLALLAGDRKSTRLNSSHVKISYAVFCLKKKIAKDLAIVGLPPRETPGEMI